jgi:3-methyladenine DNA glycosylase AlkD
MHAYLLPLISTFEENADPAQAAPMKRYMRDQFEYLGIKSELNGSLQKQFYAAHGLPQPGDMERIVHDLWALPEREYQYVGVGLVNRMEAQSPPRLVETLEFQIITRSWWDTVDSLASGTVGSHFKRLPEVRAGVLPRWRRSDNLWLRRTCILFQLAYKQETDFALLCEIIRENLGSREFFINKAIGWALRQYSRVDPQAVRAFVDRSALHPLSAREALKWLERHGQAGGGDI